MIQNHNKICFFPLIEMYLFQANYISLTDKEYLLDLNNIYPHM